LTEPRLTKPQNRAGVCGGTSYDGGAVPEAKRAPTMPKRQRPILVETYQGRFPTGLSAPDKARPYEVALALRENGWAPYRIRLETEEAVWVANVIDWGLAA
jgi:hypothetical protein